MTFDKRKTTLMKNVKQYGAINQTSLFVGLVGYTDMVGNHGLV